MSTGITYIDIIILSYAKTDELKQVTIDSINSLIKSEDREKIIFNIIVIESNRKLEPYQFEHSKTIYPNVPFGFNRYMNIGLKMSTNEYVCLCNNDLVYNTNWASEILKAMQNDTALLSASPYCPVFHKNAGFDEHGPPQQGYFGTLGGWCIFMKREIFNIIGLLDENFSFWYCDADYCHLLIKHDIKNCLIPASKVMHLGSESLKTTNYIENQKLTQLPRFYYSYKWVHHSYFKYIVQVGLFKLKMAFSLKV